MKTAISIDKKLYNDAENYSRSVGLSLNKLYSTAVSEYLQNHTPDFVTEKYNKYYHNQDSRLDSDLKATACRLFDKEDW